MDLSNLYDSGKKTGWQGKICRSAPGNLKSRFAQRGLDLHQVLEVAGFDVEVEEAVGDILVVGGAVVVDAGDVCAVDGDDVG